LEVRRRIMIAALLLIAILMPTTVMAISDDMELVGVGKAKYLGIITVYNAALYVQKNQGSENILSSDTSRCLKLDYAVEVSPEDFIRAADTILRRQHDTDKLTRFEAEINKLHRSYSKVAKGDNYTLCYDAAAKATTLYRNSLPQMEIISEEFAEIYFGIWLGAKDPLNDGLRNRLLGHN
jgi:hypothetical protein